MKNINYSKFGLIFFALLLSLFFISTVEAATLEVWPNGQGLYPTIQAAVDTANNGDTILLHNGIFTGPGNRGIRDDGPPDDRLQNLIIKSFPGEYAIIDCEYYQDNGIGINHNDGWLLENFAICNAQSDGSEKANIRISESANVTLRNLDIYGFIGGCNPSGVALNNVDGGILIENCKIHDNGLTTPMYNSANILSWLRLGSGYTIRNNEIWNSGVGIKEKHGPEGNYQPNEIYNNVIYNHTHRGISIGSENAIVHHNLIFNTSGYLPEGIRIGGQDNYGLRNARRPKIYNNTVAYCRVGILFSEIFCDNGQHAEVWNNLLYDCSDEEISFWSTPEGTPQALLDYLDYNCYFDANNNNVVRWANQLYTLAGWKTFSGLDLESKQEDPLLGEDFELLFGSPCIGEGIDRLEYDDDTIDIGAIPYGTMEITTVPSSLFVSPGGIFTVLVTFHNNTGAAGTYTVEADAFLQTPAGETLIAEHLKQKQVSFEIDETKAFSVRFRASNISGNYRLEFQALAPDNPDPVATSSVLVTVE